MTAKEGLAGMPMHVDTYLSWYVCSQVEFDNLVVGQKKVAADQTRL